jgi:hypothetical protein
VGCEKTKNAKPGLAVFEAFPNNRTLSQNGSCQPNGGGQFPGQCVCVSQVQCNPLKAFALASYGKQAVALRLWGAIQNCPVRIAAREKV